MFTATVATGIQSVNVVSHFQVESATAGNTISIPAFQQHLFRTVGAIN